MRNRVFLGIDLGTSAIKLSLLGEDGSVRTIREPYGPEETDGFLAQGQKGCAGGVWLRSLKRAFAGLDAASDVCAAAVSSQVGTYIVRGRKDPAREETEGILPWFAPEGREELEELLSTFSEETFIREIGMPHPRLISYPVPRLAFMARHMASISRVCQPKEILLEYLTGSFISDIWSWRGLAHPVTRAYSRRMLDWAGIPLKVLPPLGLPQTRAGSVSRKAAEETGLREGIPVYTGMNDFYAALKGMGVTKCGQAFDITGSSEHLGLLTSALAEGSGLMTGPAPGGYIHYGVNASSGVAYSFGRDHFPGSGGSGPDTEDPGLFFARAKHAPVFLPYLKGERAPLFDPDARGVFFGLSDETKKEDLQYAILEGIAFSLYDMYEHLGKPSLSEVIVSGGMAGDAKQNLLKAELMQAAFVPAVCREASALGASLIAREGLIKDGLLPPGEEKAEKEGSQHGAQPYTGRDHPVYRRLMKRFDLYRSLYRDLKGRFREFKEVENGDE